MTTTQCVYTTVHGGEQWCDVHDSAYPCPGYTLDDEGGLSIYQKLEDLEPGDVIDMGVFDGVDPRGPGQGPNTVNVRLANGCHYTETKGALVRVWVEQAWQS